MPLLQPVWGASAPAGVGVAAVLLDRRPFLLRRANTYGDTIVR
jgi:hypothetical protein